MSETVALAWLAVLLTLHIIIRSSEQRFSYWAETDFRHWLWTIPATREAINGVRSSGRCAKCARRIRHCALWDKTLNRISAIAASRFACSALIESDLRSQDMVESQVSHQERNTVRLADIQKAEHLEALKVMMLAPVEQQCPASMH